MAAADPALNAAPSPIPVYVISMDDERFRSAQRTLEAAGYAGARHFRGVNGRASVDAADRSIVSVDAHYQLVHGRQGTAQLPSLGAVGCTLSHLGAWNAVAASSAPFALVCEDDVAVYKHGGAAHLRALLRRLDEEGVEWDMLLLGGIQRRTRAVTVQDARVVEGVGWLVDRFLGCESYLLTPRGAATLARDALPITMQTDAYCGSLAFLGAMRVLVPLPDAFCYQNTCTRTSVQETATLHGKAIEVGRQAFCKLCSVTGDDGIVGIRRTFLAAAPVVGAIVVVALVALALRVLRASGRASRQSRRGTTSPLPMSPRHPQHPPPQHPPPTSQGRYEPMPAPRLPRRHGGKHHR